MATGQDGCQYNSWARREVQGHAGLGAGTRAEVGLVPAGGITGNKVRKVLYFI